MWHRTVLAAATLLVLILAPGLSQAAAILDRFEDQVTEFTLDNGLTFVVVERHQAPVASFVTCVRVGSVNEPAGRTGLAHLFEHMAFKGTRTIGTSDWDQEKGALARLDKAYAAWLDEKRKRNSDQGALEEKRARFESLRQEARSFVKPNEFAQIIELNGGTNLNAGTSSEYTIYFSSFPANRAELWFSLESDRLQNPVWREFYTEKEVVREERRMRVDSNPTGKLVEQLLATAFVAHPYGNPVIGWDSDILAAKAQDLDRFYSAYYVPQNMAIGIAGDVDPEQIRSWAETYFGSMPRGEDPPDVVTREPRQEGVRTVQVTSPNQPLSARAYHTVSRFHEHAPALELLGDILAKGRTSRLYRSLVEQKRVAASIFAFNGFPGDVYPSLFIVFGVPNKDVSLDELSEAIDAELERVRTQGVTQEELDRAITKAKAALIRGLDSNLGLARSLAMAEILGGDWRRVLTILDEYEQVTAAEIQEVAKTYLRRDNCTIGRLVNHEQDKGARHDQ